MIRAIRPPEIEPCPDGSWRSKWLLTASSDVNGEDLSRLGAGLSTHLPDVAAEVAALGGTRVRLEFVTLSHPLDVESYLLVDAVLVTADTLLGGLAAINDSPRDWWRPFRQQAK